MKLRLIDCKQRSAEWFAIRCGCVTSSRMTSVTAKRKKGDGEMQCRKDYKTQIVIERMTNISQDHYVSAEMIWGVDHEDEARREYEKVTGQTVATTGFYLHPTINWSGASPDGLVYNDGLVELKCPSSSTHLEYFASPNGKALLVDYYQQIQWAMACTEREWCDLVSYDPRMPERCRMVIMRVERDNGFISSLEAEVGKFLSEVDEILAKLPVEVTA